MTYIPLKEKKYSNTILMQFSFSNKISILNIQTIIIEINIIIIIIYYYIYKSKFLFSISFDGEIVMMHKETLQFISKVKSKGRDVRFASSNNELLCVSCEAFNNKDIGSLEVYKIA